MAQSGETQPPRSQPRPQSTQNSSESRPSYFSGNYQTSGQATLKFFFVIVLYAAFHWFVDYQIFEFENSLPRILFHLLFAILYCSMYLNEKGRPSTIKVLAIVAFFNYLISFCIYSYFPAVLRYGGPELIAGSILLLLLIVKPTIFSKDLQENPYDRAVISIFILSAYFLPAITGFASSFGTTSIGAMFVDYLSPFFFPIWMYYFFLGRPASQASGWARALIVVIFILLLSPLWMGPASSSFSTTTGSGVTDSQKDVFVNYMIDAGDKAMLFGRTFTNASSTAISCWWYTTSGQLDSITGKTTATNDPKYLKCVRENNPGSDISDFDSSVEQGALSTSSMSLGSVVAAQQKYYQSQDATFLTTFKAQSFDTEITVAPYCTFRLTSADKDKVSTITPPPSNFTIEGSAQQDIVCTIPAGDLAPAKSYEFISGVAFDYVTSAYIPRYFTTTETLNSFTSSGSLSPAESLLTFYGANLKPVSKSTKGPVKVGISAENSLIVFAEQNSLNKKEFTVVVTIENQNSWKGKMQEVKSILLALPKGVELKEKQTTATPMPVAPSRGTKTPEPSWSNYQCTTGAFTGNFAQLKEELCLPENRVGTDFAAYSDLDCVHYNYYYLTPGYGTGKTGVEVSSGLEITQKPFVSCQAVAADSSALLPRNINFATKSIQARVKYSYQLEQSRSFKVEALGDGESAVFSDPVLANKELCGIKNAYSLEPNVLMSFYKNNEVSNSALLESLMTTVDDFSSKITPQEDAVLSGLDCPTFNIALATIHQDWKQVQGNPMFSTSSYGYLRANKKMIDYVLASGAKIGDMESTADSRYNDATLLDKFLRENALLVGTSYISALAKDSACKSSATDSITDYSCVVGKLKCGQNYIPKVYSSCTTPSSCQYCEQTTATDILTLATQIDQLTDGSFSNLKSQIVVSEASS